ncbi:MAG: hypothetical protein KTR30_13825 [Saprospiraceae bacterium]|nr:hypothetical protein [Saprospiraceae bacterium]
MAHPKVKENSSIVTILKPILELNPQQVQLLEQLEYEWYRSYQFDVPKFYSPKVAAIRSIRRLLPVLEKEQIKKLKTVLQENRKEQKIYDQAQMERRSFERLFKSLSFLTLRPEQEALVHRLWEEKGLLRTEKYLEHLEATLDAEQSTAHKKYKEKQDRLFREGQENHVRFAYEHLALEEEQFKEVVEYHMKNYWRDWLPGEELKEEAKFMQTILTVKQWKKYQTDLDRLSGRC